DAAERQDHVDVAGRLHPGSSLACRPRRPLRCLRRRTLTAACGAQRLGQAYYSSGLLLVCGVDIRSMSLGSCAMRRNRVALLVALGVDNLGSGSFLPVTLLYV